MPSNVRIELTVDGKDADKSEERFRASTCSGDGSVDFLAGFLTSVTWYDFLRPEYRYGNVSKCETENETSSHLIFFERSCRVSGKKTVEYLWTESSLEAVTKYEQVFGFHSNKRRCAVVNPAANVGRRRDELHP